MRRTSFDFIAGLGSEAHNFKNPPVRSSSTCRVNAERRVGRLLRGVMRHEKQQRVTRSFQTSQSLSGGFCSVLGTRASRCLARRRTPAVSREAGDACGRGARRESRRRKRSSKNEADKCTGKLTTRWNRKKGSVRQRKAPGVSRWSQLSTTNTADYKCTRE